MKQLKTYLVIGGALLLVYLVAQYYRPKPINWTVTFNKEDKIPYGTYVVYNRLKDIFPEQRIRTERRAPYLTFTEDTVETGSYILIAETVKMDEYDFHKLRNYMLRGNTVLIAAYYPGTYLTDSLGIKINTELSLGSEENTSLHFVNPSLDPSRKYRFDKGIGQQYFSGFDTSKAVVLGMNNRGHANFIRYTYGKGNLFLLASPFFFSNYNMLKPDGAEYASKTLSYLKPGREVVWDEFSSLGNEDNSSPMRVFLRNPSLKWAWYLSLFSLLIFVIYEIKRRQRIIPVIEPLKNTSADFVRVVGRVYYEQKDHTDIAKKKVVYLLEFIRSRYHLKMEKPDKKFSDLLSAKSGIDNVLIVDLVRQMAQLARYNMVSERELIELNKNIESFYQKSR
ncbi:hypothetical protein BDE36_0743 [Arcticibacter tournemirensis]|uniref:DUF4350 domain-containing protein n=1 Tax=Arcticibacter tournemirensis TaxID=699437 RepID=A0A5M9H6S2_9SPHI|nr:DUF4350 domain-containing protein [Arcticibacter tournemirensis]KAA8481561.1 DUF4350 domain-containing protein [Arcticibacter tournemirensis]TQM49051.1 hypothetical protein BDE36_0743 [Arcticibacter tournemirensis]